MKYARAVLGIVLALPLFLPLFAAASTPSPVLIVEIQTGSTTSASEEFVELYNRSDQTFDISTWHLDYKSATGASWTHKVTLHGSLYPGGRYLLASTSYLANATDDSFAPGLASTGGHVRLTAPDVAQTSGLQIYDTVGWGSSANAAEGNAPTAAPAAGQSLKRRVDADGHLIDTDNNASDFGAPSDSPSPESDNQPPAGGTTDPVEPPAPDPVEPPVPIDSPPPIEEPPVSDPPAQPPASAPDETAVTPAANILLPPQITELLPNPAPPQTDDADEYVELFNPNPQSLNLTGYKLQTGSNFSYSYVFTEGSLAPGAYQAFLVSQTGLVLANGGGQARLMSPDGQLLGSSDPYADAKAGEAWALIDSTWQWTTSPTPNATNVLGQLSAGPTTTPKTTAAKKTATKTASTAKPKVAAASTKKAAAPKAKTTAANSTSDPETLDQTTPLHPFVLAAVAGSALLYAGYEYRHDLANRFYQLKRYRETRRAARQTT